MHYVRIVTTHKGGATTEDDIRFASRQSAIEACERLQAEFDADCDPKRAYVLDAHKVPIAAGGEHRSNQNRSQRKTAP